MSLTFKMEETINKVMNKFIINTYTRSYYREKYEETGAGKGDGTHPNGWEIASLNREPASGVVKEMEPEQRATEGRRLSLADAKGRRVQKRTEPVQRP